MLSDASDHPDAEELYRRAAALDPHISIATVYRTVKLFEDAGILESGTISATAAHATKKRRTRTTII